MDFLICKKCGAHYCQLGLEPTPEMFVDHLIEIFREVKRVLKQHGNVFVVIDDTYSGSGKGFGSVDPKWPKAKNGKLDPKQFKKVAPEKSLCLVPELFAIRMVYQEGWILRNKIIWPKKVFIYKDRTTIGNAMPESVKDRLCHVWEYVFHFVKKPKYWYDLDAVRVPHKYLEVEMKRKNFFDIVHYNEKAPDQVGKSRIGRSRAEDFHPLGANPGDVVQINTEPLKDNHYAPFPTKLVELLIKVGCPEQICKKCSKPYEKEYEEVDVSDIIDWKYYGANENGEYHGQPLKDYESAKAQNPSEVKRRILQSLRKGKVFKGYKPSCNCKASTEPGIILDPFLGSGTTALVALQMGRRFIGIELSRKYCELALKRIKQTLLAYTD